MGAIYTYPSHLTMSRVGHCQRQPLPLPLCHMLRQYITCDVEMLLEDSMEYRQKMIRNV